MWRIQAVQQWMCMVVMYIKLIKGELLTKQFAFSMCYNRIQYSYSPSVPFCFPVAISCLVRFSTIS